MLAITKVKQEIEFNTRFHSLVDILKSVAVQQFHALESNLNIFATFDERLQGFFDLLKHEHMEHRFLTQNEGAILAIAVTSDQGMLGGLNHRIVSTAINTMKTDRDELIVVGEQGKTYARGIGSPFTSFPGVRDDLREAQAKALRNYLFQRIMKADFGYVQVVYARALSLIQQQVELATLLPIPKFEGEAQGTVDLSEMIIESPLPAILEYLTFLRIGRKLGDIFALSRLAETAARYVHLEESGQRLDEINKKLKLKYFKLRHEVIDQGMRELFAGRIISEKNAESPGT